MNFRRFLQSPLLAATIAIGASGAIGVVICWRASGPIVKDLLAKRAKSVEDKREKGWDFWTIEIENLSNELKEERARLRKQSELLDQRAAAVVTQERELAKVRAEIEAMRQEIKDKVIEITEDETKNIRSLAQTYTNLSPRAVVTIFRELDDTTAVKILSVMKPDVIGPIFEEMSRPTNNDATLARRAAVLSEKLRLMKAAKAANPS